MPRDDLTSSDVDALAATMPERLRLAVILSGYLGLGQDQVLALRRRDVDVVAGELRIADGTAPFERLLPFHPTLFPAVEAHLAEHVDFEDDAFLFAGADGAAVSGAALARAVQSAAEKAGLPGTVLSDLQASAARRRLTAG